MAPIYARNKVISNLSHVDFPHRYLHDLQEFGTLEFIPRNVMFVINLTQMTASKHHLGLPKLVRHKNCPRKASFYYEQLNDIYSVEFEGHLVLQTMEGCWCL